VLHLPSRRKDVPIEGLEELIPLPGQSFKDEYDAEGVALLLTRKVGKISKEMLGPLMK